MKKFSTLMLLAGATYALTGCMITDYPCITDTENPDYAVCATNSGPALHDTQGWAHIIESSQTATDNNGDGIFSNFIAFVSQDSNGNQQIADVAEVNTAAAFTFHDDTYAQGAQKDLGPIFAYAAQGNPPGGYQSGTPTATSPNPGVVGAPTTGNCADPETVAGTGSPAFDYVLVSCQVANPDLSVLVSYFTRTGEAGRVAGGKKAGLTMAQRVDILKNATPTANGMSITLKQGDLSVLVSQGSMSKTLDLSHLYGRTFTVDLDKRVHLGNDVAKSNGITGSDLMATYNQLVGFNQMLPATVTVTAFGQTQTFTSKLAQGFDAQLLAATLDAANGTGSNQTGSRRR